MSGPLDRPLKAGTMSGPLDRPFKAGKSLAIKCFFCNVIFLNLVMISFWFQ